MLSTKLGQTHKAVQLRPSGKSEGMSNDKNTAAVLDVRYDEKDVGRLHFSKGTLPVSTGNPQLHVRFRFLGRLYESKSKLAQQKI